MPKHKDKPAPISETQGVVAAIKAVQKMSGERARFALTALLAADHVPMDVFARILKMADHPTPIEQRGQRG